MAHNAEIGTNYERLAADHLRGRGLQIIEHNFRSRSGEIDLICIDQTTIVFVEVKMRSSNSFGGPAAAVTTAKQAKIKRCASFYLTMKNLHRCNCRFDVVAILDSGEGPCIDWIENAF